MNILELLKKKPATNPVKVICGDVTRLGEYIPEGERFHALICDVPYLIGFMGKSWDSGGISYQPEMWAQFHEFLYPGAFGMTFAGARTSHRIACAIEDAGFVLHDKIFLWGFSSGFPKGAKVKGAAFGGHRYGHQNIKPSAEVVILFRRPYEGKPQEDITKTGAGSLNIDAGRVGYQSDKDKASATPQGECTSKESAAVGAEPDAGRGLKRVVFQRPELKGRYPANLVLCHHPECRPCGTKQVKPLEGHRPNPVAVQSDGHIQFNKKPAGYQKTSYTEPDGIESAPAYDCHPDCPVKQLDETVGVKKSGKPGVMRKCKNDSSAYGAESRTPGTEMTGFGDSGNVSRFFFQSDWNLETQERLDNADALFYSGKAKRGERDAGLDERCPHPTMKPLALTNFLARLLLPPAKYAPRKILVPFGGVCSEAIGAMLAGWEDVMVVEQDADYCDLGRKRVEFWHRLMVESGTGDVKVLSKLSKKLGK